MPDFRSERSATPDGQGIAKGRWAKAFDAYVRAVRPFTDPVVMPFARPLAQATTFDLVGFWVAWHTCGGFEGLQKNVGMSRSAVYRRISAFRTVFGEHPDTFRMPGVEINVEEFIRSAATQPGDPSKQES